MRRSQYCRLTKALEKKFATLQEMVQLVEARLNDMDAEYKARLDNMSADLVGIDAVKMLQNDRLDGIDADQITQDGRLDDIEAEQIVQNGRLDDIVVDQITQDGRLVGIDAEQLIQNMRLDDIETEQTAQNMRLDDIESQPGGSAGDVKSYAVYAHNVIEIDPPLNKVLRFNMVQLNEDNPYNFSGGRYTAPVDGVYRFDVSLCTTSTKTVSAEFDQSGSINQRFGIIRSAAGSCTSNFGTTRLAQYDEVYIKVIENSGSGSPTLVNDGVRRNSFSGHYLGS